MNWTKTWVAAVLLVFLTGTVFAADTTLDIEIDKAVAKLKRNQRDADKMTLKGPLWFVGGSGIMINEIDDPDDTDVPSARILAIMEPITVTLFSGGSTITETIDAGLLTQVPGEPDEFAYEPLFPTGLVEEILIAVEEGHGKLQLVFVGLDLSSEGREAALNDSDPRGSNPERDAVSFTLSIGDNYEGSTGLNFERREKGSTIKYKLKKR